MKRLLFIKGDIAVSWKQFIPWIQAGIIKIT